MATLFIADLHLSEHEPAIVAGFLRFLRTDARHAEALYILGDLFDAWIGDDDPSPLHQSVAGALLTLHQQGVPCYFIHGNRDFLLGRRFADRCAMTLLPEEQALELYGRRLVILHGDTLCSDDLAYQRYRRRVHNPLIQRLFLALPLRLRLRIAARMRASSSEANQHKSARIMDVNPQQVVLCLQRHRAQWMIHGHTHRPAIHDVDVDGRPAQRAVLGAWHREGSMIRVTAEGIELLSFPF
ncbi:UDP-2,3-diacylglucosamine diphosphatase [Affinibrenneria salicis]|uniref:UDP-2,3-diacylglucosamine hydrolase n=1 Tax=Affinibrenneria salicis TaxID=2590031 RepID=A0A5J5FXT4_9GAMM|nr:UDP-2,3-diacylglucosamine diphosphatase [Affinibrenneria salicis]KAA8998915.1 UDP-2,3-diacylglucosamine diphosphatase [Affinibrenneria salicis]